MGQPVCSFAEQWKYLIAAEASCPQISNCRRGMPRVACCVAVVGRPHEEGSLLQIAIIFRVATKPCLRAGHHAKEDTYFHHLRDGDTSENSYTLAYCKNFTHLCNSKTGLKHSVSHAYAVIQVVFQTVWVRCSTDLTHYWRDIPTMFKRGHCPLHRVHDHAFSCHAHICETNGINEWFFSFLLTWTRPRQPPYKWRFSRWLQMLRLWLRKSSAKNRSTAFPKLCFCQSVKQTLFATINDQLTLLKSKLAELSTYSMFL